MAAATCMNQSGSGHRYSASLESWTKTLNKDYGLDIIYLDKRNSIQRKLSSPLTVFYFDGSGKSIMKSLTSLINR